MKSSEVVLIPVSDVHVLNPRVRNQGIAEEIQRNIRDVGLKRPITVILCTEPRTGKKYDLVCGQGRLEAFIASEEAEIPAIVIETTKENAHIMSLVENIARRNNNSLELLHGVRLLKNSGYNETEIAQKTGLCRDWIRGILRLLENGEERLVSAVEKGRMPLYIALKIATENKASVQIALTEAHEKGQLSGPKLLAVQKILDSRSHFGKQMSAFYSKQSTFSSEELVTLYANSVKNKRWQLAKAEHLQQVLTYTAAVLNKLLRDVHFTNQLKAEGLSDIPMQLSKFLKEAH